MFYKALGRPRMATQHLGLGSHFLYYSIKIYILLVYYKSNIKLFPLREMISFNLLVNKLKAVGERTKAPTEERIIAKGGKDSRSGLTNRPKK